jgi:large subunit GTPase 1
VTLLFFAYLVSGRHIWADYFDSQGLHYAFYSATNATTGQEALHEAPAVGELVKATEENQRVEFSEEDEESDEETSSTPSAGSYDSIESETPDELKDPESDEDASDKGDPRAKVLSVLELEDFFIASAPELSGEFPSVVCYVIHHLTYDCRVH